jgi:glycerol-3-phosphate acyltransferase PlsY
MISKAIILPLFAYFLGSVPWGVIFTRLFSDVNIQEAGSRNIGAYNVYRLAGKKLGIMTLVGDILKGVIPVLIAVCWVDISDWKGELWVCLVAVSVCALVYILALCTTGYSSAGSLSAAVVLPCGIWLGTHSVPITGCAVLMAFFIFARHADNIRRLIDGTEHSSMRPERRT